MAIIDTTEYQQEDSTTTRQYQHTKDKSNLNDNKSITGKKNSVITLGIGVALGALVTGISIFYGGRFLIRRVLVDLVSGGK
jgi:hypothetical protein